MPAFASWAELTWLPVKLSMFRIIQKVLEPIIWVRVILHHNNSTLVHDTTKWKSNFPLKTIATWIFLVSTKKSNYSISQLLLLFLSNYQSYNSIMRDNCVPTFIMVRIHATHSPRAYHFDIGEHMKYFICFDIWFHMKGIPVRMYRGVMLGLSGASLIKYKCHVKNAGVKKWQ